MCIKFQSLLLFWFAFGCYSSTALSSNGCHESGYTPIHGYRKPPVNDLDVVYYEGSKLRYYCDEGYFMTTENAVQICTLNNIDDEKVTWVPQELPKCVLKAQCPTIKVTDGSSIEGPFYTGDRVDIEEVSCDEGYTVDVPSYVVCTENGTWSDNFVCSEKQCPDLGKPANGYVYIYDHSHSKKQQKGQTWPPGSTAWYICDKPYILINDRRRNCALGKWSGEAAQCVTSIPLSCPSPPSILNGKYSPVQRTYKVGSNVTYSCNDNSIPQGGDLSITCLEGFTWSGITPHCTGGPATPPGIMFCPRPSPISHGVVLCCPHQDDFPPDTCCPTSGKVQFACEPGYQLYHGTEWTCSNIGQWLLLDDTPVLNSSNPTCVLEITTNPSKANTGGQLSSEMIKTVLGVSIGVLSLLTTLLVLAFCKPKLKEMKRRWRDFREDEVGLIINGQRVTLPSYDEAITTNDIYQQVHQPPVLNNFSNSRSSEAVTRPPESNINSTTVGLYSQLSDNSTTEVPNPDLPSTSSYNRYSFKTSSDDTTSSQRLNTSRSDSPISVTEFLLNSESTNSETSPEIEANNDIGDDVSLISLSMPTSSANNECSVAYKDERYLNQDTLMFNHQEATVTNQEKFQVTSHNEAQPSTNSMEIIEAREHTDSTSL